MDFHLLEAHIGLSLLGQIEMKAKLPKDKGQTPSMVDVARHVGAHANSAIFVPPKSPPNISPPPSPITLLGFFLYETSINLERPVTNIPILKNASMIEKGI